MLSNIRGTMPVFIATARLAGGDVERALTHAIRTVDPGLPRPQVFPVDDLVTRSLARERFGATLLSLLAALALALTAFGIYGVLAYTIQQQRREIWIRMALGASAQQVTRLVMVQGIAPVLVGVLLGISSSLGLSRLIAGFLWGVTPTDRDARHDGGDPPRRRVRCELDSRARGSGPGPSRDAELRIGLLTATLATTARARHSRAGQPAASGPAVSSRPQ